jgi:hypothetical protein
MGQKWFFHNIGFMGIKRRRILCRFQKYKLVLWQQTSKSRLKICFTTQGAPCAVKHKLYPGFSCFRGILSLIQVWNLRKILRFFIPIMRGFEKKFFTPHMCQCAFLRQRQGARAWSKKFFLPVSHFLHQNETTAGWQDPKIKFSFKINSPYCTEVNQVKKK